MIVDCQSHLFDPRWLEYLASRPLAPSAERRADGWRLNAWRFRPPIPEAFTDPATKLRAMDVAGVDIALLSTNLPGPETYGDDGLDLARHLNDWTAEVVATRPDRFRLVVTPPLQAVDASIAEIERGVRELGACAVQIYTRTPTARPDEAPFEPLWSAIEELDVPAILHPAYPQAADAVAGYGMVAGLGTRFEDTIALTRIILSGLLDRHPSLRLVCPHLGGTLPFFIGQIDHQTMVLGRGADHISKPPSEYLQQVYLDTVSPTPAALRFVADTHGPARMLYGSDHPWIQPQVLVDMLRALDLPADQLEMIFGGNARAVFKLD